MWDHDGPSPLALDLGRRQLAETTKRRPRTLAVVVLAAGKGKRLKSVTQGPASGRRAAVLWHVLQTGRAARPSKIVIVVGHGADDVRAAVAPGASRRSRSSSSRPSSSAPGTRSSRPSAPSAAPTTCWSRTATSTPSGPRTSAPRCAPTADTKRAATVAHDRARRARRLRPRSVRRGPARRDRRGRRRHARRGPGDPRGRDELDRLPARRPVPRAAARRPREPPARVLPEPRDPAILLDKGERVRPSTVDTGGAMGAELARRARRARARSCADAINAAHMATGVTLVDPGTTYIDVGVQIGADTVIYPLTFLDGRHVDRRGGATSARRRGSPTPRVGDGRRVGSRSSRARGSAAASRSARSPACGRARSWRRRARRARTSR